MSDSARTLNLCRSISERIGENSAAVDMLRRLGIHVSVLPSVTPSVASLVRGDGTIEICASAGLWVCLEDVLNQFHVSKGIDGSIQLAPLADLPWLRQNVVAWDDSYSLHARPDLFGRERAGELTRSRLKRFLDREWLSPRLSVPSSTELELVISFQLLHEVWHVIGGHLDDPEARAYGQSWKFEFLADYRAACTLVRVLSSRRTKLANLPVDVSCRMVYLGSTIGHSLLIEHLKHPNWTSQTHPSPLDRIVSLGVLLSMTDSTLLTHRSDRERVFAGLHLVSKQMEAMGAENTVRALWCLNAQALQHAMDNAPNPIADSFLEAIMCASKRRSSFEPIAVLLHSVRRAFSRSAAHS